MSESSAGDQVIERADWKSVRFEIGAHLSGGSDDGAVEWKHRHGREKHIELLAPFGGLGRLGDADFDFLERDDRHRNIGWSRR